ncbi:MAG: hypothetical protein Rpha_0986 [Candidatus Ruthia sp. Apha_13_S6]|nr:hypothetical protein [Candidatus Ruthia sp. Apha_13_S6]
MALFVYLCVTNQDMGRNYVLGGKANNRLLISINLEFVP